MASILKVDRGTTYTITLNYKRNGQPASLVGATVRFTVKVAESDADTVDSDALVKKDITNHTDPVGGVTVITLNPADTATVKPGKYWYDIKVENADATIYKLNEGTFQLDGSPTNRYV